MAILKGVDLKSNTAISSGGQELLSSGGELKGSLSTLGGVEIIDSSGNFKSSSGDTVIDSTGNFKSSSGDTVIDSTGNFKSSSGDTVIDSTGNFKNSSGDTVIDSIGTVRVLTNYTESNKPSNPANGTIIYNTEKQRLEIYRPGGDRIEIQTMGSTLRKENENWVPLSWETHVPSFIDRSLAFKYRQIITRGYVMGGYKSASPWRNVNKMNHATDIMFNLGDLLSHSAAYTSGACNLTRGYLWSADSTWPGTSAQTTSFNMYNDSASNLYGGNMNMQVGRNDCATMQKEHYFAYIVGGGNSYVDIFNLTTEVMSGSGHGGATSLSGDSAQAGCGSFHDELKGFVYQDSNNGHRFNFATSTSSSSYTVTTGMGTVRGVHSQQKGISSKNDKGYCGNEGSYNGGYNLRRFTLSNETALSNVSKPIGNSGEENFDMGQDHQYMMGMYDGAQNNRGWRFSYSTDSGYELSTGQVRTGVPGGSSGYCTWA